MPSSLILALQTVALYAPHPEKCAIPTRIARRPLERASLWYVGCQGLIIIKRQSPRFDGRHFSPAISSRVSIAQMLGVVQADGGNDAGMVLQDIGGVSPHSYRDHYIHPHFS